MHTSISCYHDTNIGQFGLGHFIRRANCECQY